MSDPRRPDGYDPNRPYWPPPGGQPTEQMGAVQPPADPAYGGNYSYPGYSPPGPPGSPRGPEPTQILPPYWTQTQYPPPPPPPSDGPPPGRPGSPRWLWVVAGAAVMLVIGLVIALVIANGSTRDETAVAPLPPMPEPTSAVPPPTTTRTTTRTPAPTPTTTQAPETTTAPATTTPTDEAATEAVVYSVTGDGRAISITYVDTGGILQMEFNVMLPWTREVSLSPSTVRAASVTVINVGREIGCSITLNGAQTQQRTGTGLTICSSMGG